MTKSAPYVPTHRAPGKHKAVRGSRRALRSTLVLTGVAVAATGVSISGGLVADDLDVTPAAADITTAIAVPNPSAVTSRAPSLNPSETRRRSQTVASRSQTRRQLKATKAEALSVAQGATVSHSEDLSDDDPRDIARALLPLYGFDSSQFSCLDFLYVSESDWRVDADNPSSSAYGIPQALTQLHDLPADYMTSAESQIRWGLEYIQDTYGTPCSAWSFKQGAGWY